jgi:hypothetical protein
MTQSHNRASVVDRTLKDPNTPIDQIFKFGVYNTALFLKHPLIRLALATDPRFMDRLLESRHQRLLVKILRNGTGYGPEFLRKLAMHPKTSWGIHRLIAASPHLNRQIARRYLRSHLLVHITLANNPALDPTLVRYFAQHQSIGVRVQIAERKDLNDTAVKRLLRDTVHVVRWTLAQNRACPRWAMEQLAADPMSSVAHSARRTMGHTLPLPELQEWVSTYR